MQIRELRIGNLIQEGKVEQIDNSIDEVYYSGDGYYQSNYCCNLNPIPLTEEWLLKFGFEKSSKHIFKKDGFLISLDIVFEVFLGNIVVEIKYVHQLQNLFYCLSGKEL
jgi:hypothetical protein